MNKILIITGLFFFSAMGASASDYSPEDQQLMVKVEQFFSSIREGDKEKYSDVFTDDFIFTWSKDGHIYTKEQILPNVKPTPDYRPDISEVLIRHYGDSAIVNCRVTRNEGSMVRITFSFARIDDEWKATAIQGTNIIDGGKETE